MSKYLLPVLVVALGAFFVFQPDPQESEQTAQTVSPAAQKERLTPLVGKKVNATPWRVAFSKEARLAFSFSMRTRYQINPAALTSEGQAGPNMPISRGRKRTDMKLLWRLLEEKVDEAGDTIWVLAMVAREPLVLVGDDVVDTPFVKAFEAPIFIKMDSSGRFLSLAKTAATPAPTFREWQMSLSMLELVVASKSEGQWIVEQQDATGLYTGRYRWSGNTLTKQRTNYLSTLSPSPDVPLQAYVIASATEAQRQGDDPWFGRIDSREHIRVTTESGLLFADADTELNVRRISTPENDRFWEQRFELGALEWMSLADLLGDQLPPLPYANRPPLPGVGTMSMDDALKRFADFLAQQAGYDQALNLMVQYLRADPTRIARVMTLLRDGQLDAKIHSALFLAVGLTGGKIARETLIAGTGDQELSEMNRLRALSALKDLPRPNGEVVATIKSIWADEQRPLDEKNSALFAMGAMSQNQVLDEATREELKTSVVKALDQAKDSSGAVIAMGALGNTGDPALADLVRPFTKSDDISAKATAYETLNRLGREPDVSEALAVLQESDHPRTQDEMGKSLERRAAEATADDLATSATLLQQGQLGKTQRQSLIRFLGRAAPNNANAKAILVDHFDREKDKDLLILIGKYLPATAF